MPIAASPCKPYKHTHWSLKGGPYHDNLICFHSQKLGSQRQHRSMPVVQSSCAEQQEHTTVVYSLSSWLKISSTKKYECVNRRVQEEDVCRICMRPKFIYACAWACLLASSTWSASWRNAALLYSGIFQYYAYALFPYCTCCSQLVHLLFIIRA